MSDSLTVSSYANTGAQSQMINMYLDIMAEDLEGQTEERRLDRS